MHLTHLPLTVDNPPQFPPRSPDVTLHPGFAKQSSIELGSHRTGFKTNTITHHPHYTHNIQPDHTFATMITDKTKLTSTLYFPVELDPYSTMVLMQL
jgi:hypothetical protein